MRRTSTPDGRISRLAARHHGLVTRQRALECGLTDRQIAHRVGIGLLERLGPGVYRVVGAPSTDAQRAYAAVLIAGPQTVVCGLSALALVGIGTAPKTPYLCAPPSGGATTPGAVVRRSPLQPADRTHVGPIPATTPARALLEAAAIVPVSVLEQLLDDVVDAGLGTPSAILGAIRRAAVGRGREGAPQLRGVLTPWLDGVRPGSPAEVRLLRRLADVGLRAPVRQHVVALPNGATAVLDLAWPQERVALEYDGERWHNPRRLAADVHREEQLRALGWWIGRVDRHDLAPSSTRVVDELARRLRRSAA